MLNILLLHNSRNSSSIKQFPGEIKDIPIGYIFRRFSSSRAYKSARKLFTSIRVRFDHEKPTGSFRTCPKSMKKKISCSNWFGQRQLSKNKVTEDSFAKRQKLTNFPWSQPRTQFDLLFAEKFRKTAVGNWHILSTNFMSVGKRYTTSSEVALPTWRRND